MKRYITQLFVKTDLTLPNLKHEVAEKILSKNIKIERCKLAKMPKYDGENVFSFVATSTKNIPSLKKIFNDIGNVTWFVVMSDNNYTHNKHPTLKPFDEFFKIKMK